MNLKSIFGATFFSVLAALAIWKLFGEGLLDKVKSSYDGTSNFTGGKNSGEANLIGTDSEGNKYYSEGEKVYRVRNHKRVAA